MSQNQVARFASLMVGAVSLSGCAVAPGDRAPDWTLRDIHDEEQRFSDHAGKVVVLDFWATWCAPCLPVSPHMQALHEKYGDKGVVVIGIHYNDQGDPAAYMKEHGFTYISVVNGLEVAKKYGSPRSRRS